MPIYTKDEIVEVELDPSKFQATHKQETDYNNVDDILLDAVRSKAGMLIKDFDTEGILSIAFPTIFCNEA